MMLNNIARLCKEKGISISRLERELGFGNDIRYSDREDGGPYSYDSLVSKPDMAVTTVGGNVPNSRADVVYQAKQNARKIGKFNTKDGSVSVYVKDIGRDVVLSTAGLKHSLDRRFDVNAPVTLRAGSILQNSIMLNEMTAQHPNAENSYILVGAAENSKGQLYIVRSVVNRFSNEVTSMDVLYAFNAKTEPDLSIKKGTGRETIPNGPRQSAATITDSTISISELLDYVNEYFPDILPESVLKHYGHDARPTGKLGESALYSDRYSTEGKLTAQNEKLKADVANLRELLKLQGETTDGKVFKKDSLKTAVNYILRETGRSLDADGKAELADMLGKTYAGLDPDSKIAWDAKETLQQVDGLVQMWADMAVDSAENYREASGEKVSSQDAAKLSDRERTNATSLVGQLKNNIDEIQKIGVVAEVTGDELRKDLRPTDATLDFIKKFDCVVTRDGFGDVRFSKTKIKSGLVGHGMGNAKIETFAAVPAVIQNGIELGFAQNWKDSGKDSYIFAAPVKYKGETAYIGVIVEKDPVSNMYYVHEVVDDSGNVFAFESKKEEPASDRLTTHSGSIDTVASSSAPTVSQNGGDVNKKFSDRDMDSEYMALAADPEKNEIELSEMVIEAAKRNGFSFRRNTRRRYQPQNDVPWQMFVEGLDNYATDEYGEYSYFATGDGAINSEDILPKLRELAEEYYGEEVEDDVLNPPDIVMSAGIWDDVSVKSPPIWHHRVSIFSSPMPRLWGFAPSNHQNH